MEQSQQKKTQILGVLIVGVALCFFGFGLKDAESAAFLYPELAVKNGYFVDHEQAVRRGGVGSYAFRPTKMEDKNRLALYRSVGKFAEFYRGDDGFLQIQLKENNIFAPGTSFLTQDARQQLDEVSQLMKLDGVRNIEISGYVDDRRGLSDVSETLADERAVAVRDYLSPRIGTKDIEAYVAYEDDDVRRRWFTRTEYFILGE